MLIKVFDSEWFDPAGVRVDFKTWMDGYEQKSGARIKFGAYSQKNPDYGHASYPVPEYYDAIDCIIIEGKSADEVAEEINRQLNV